jgi:hypothetical protein
MSRALLTLIVSVFLLPFGGGIWKRAHLAVAPPIYDPIGYYCRAQLVWTALAKGDLHGILNGPMATRPPGPAFILYPFGFRVSIKSFLFRSVFVPILIWAIALGVPLVRPERISDAISVSSWSEEVERFKQFAYSGCGVDKNGLLLVSDGAVKVLRVADPRRFSEALYAWANSIRWTDDFRDRNRVFLERAPQ